ncbi:MAG: (2Fe-2S) ferredoxin domain-containing protein [Nitrospinae bacterium]|nr:(2Fe-2S) ferredoxin domain-containing protein [Nitrospinota bacterium]
MPKPKHHVFICTNQRPEGHPRGSCAQKNAMLVWQKFADLLNEKMLFSEIFVSGVRSCLGPCGQGPVVVVHPDNVWYANVTEADVAEIFEKHLIGGKPVERLLMPEEVFG